MSSIPEVPNLEKKFFLDYIGLGELKQHSGAPLSFFLILLMSFFLFADQNLIAPNFQSIGKSLGIQSVFEMDRLLGGIVPVCFFILGGLVSLSMGYFTQRFPRKNLLILSVILGEVPCFLTSYANSFSEFLIYRTLCGFGLGGVFPIIFSIVGDYLSSRSRAIGAGYISLSMGLGVAIGQLVGAILGASDPVNGWRLSFQYLSIPSFFIVILYAVFCKEPIRGASEDGVHSVDKMDHTFDWSQVKKMLSSPVNQSILLQGIPGCVPWGVFFVFLTDYYETHYSLDKISASGLMTYAALGIMTGIFLGGLIGQRLYNQKKEYQPLFAMSAILLGVIPCFLLIYSSKDFATTPAFAVLNFITGFIISIPGPNLRSILISSNPPNVRSSAFALYNLTDDLGKGLGPALSAMILWMIPDRTLAFAASILFWIPCGLIWIPIIRNISSQEDKAKLEWKSEIISH
jgi:MFS family permease